MKPLIPVPVAAGTVKVMLALLLAALTASFPETAVAQERRFLVGMHLEKNASLQPGLEVGYASSRILGGRPRLTLSYSTTRLATAFGSHALAKDRLLAAVGWYFRPHRRIDPYLHLELGYARFDREDPERFALLDNDAAIAAVLFGIETRFLGDVGLYGDLGYSILHSSTVYPFVASLGLHINVSRKPMP